MDWIIKILVTVAGFVLMEGVAWFTHKYIMHGFLWNWHKSHHSPRHGVFERNDLFALVFASIGIALILWGVKEFAWQFYMGLGISLYGLAYFLVHDVFIHQRVRWFKKTNNRYFQAMRFAHKIHHKTSAKHGAEAFGFLFVHKKFLQKFNHNKSA
jgi:beta-carotene 3-hydroxylase